jgi:hypothetical protein
MVENQHATKCWARLSTNCCTFFWQSSLHICVSTKSSIELGSCPRTIAHKKKKLSVKYIYIKKTNKKMNVIKKKSYHSLYMWNKQNRAASVCGNITMNTPVLILCTRLWPSSETRGRDMLNVFCPYNL